MTWTPTPNRCGVYCIINTLTRKCYVGSGRDCFSRLREHFRTLRLGSHRNSHLQASFCKYGSANFSWVMLERCPDTDRWEREQYWIDTWNTASSNGYNIRPRADLKTVSDITKRKISQTLKAAKRSMPPHVRAALMANRPKGGPRSPEWRRKISQALRGRKRPEFSDEWKRNMARPSRFRAVDCFGLDGYFIGSFSQIKEAALALTGDRRCGISLCLSGKKKTAYGYIWKPSQNNKTGTDPVK